MGESVFLLISDEIKCNQDKKVSPLNFLVGFVARKFPERLSISDTLLLRRFILMLTHTREVNGTQVDIIGEREKSI